MKIKIIGVQRRFGQSARTNNNYDMAQLNVMSELQSQVNPNNTFQASGFRVVEYNLDPEAIGQFLELKYPGEYEVVTEARPSSSGAVTYVVGLKQ